MLSTILLVLLVVVVLGLIIRWSVHIYRKEEKYQNYLALVEEQDEINNERDKLHLEWLMEEYKEEIQKEDELLLADIKMAKVLEEEIFQTIREFLEIRLQYLQYKLQIIKCLNCPVGLPFDCIWFLKTFISYIMLKKDMEAKLVYLKEINFYNFDIIIAI